MHTVEQLASNNLEAQLKLFRDKSSALDGILYQSRKSLELAFNKFKSLAVINNEATDDSPDFASIPAMSSEDYYLIYDILSTLKNGQYDSTLLDNSAMKVYAEEYKKANDMLKLLKAI